MVSEWVKHITHVSGGDQCQGEKESRKRGRQNAGSEKKWEEVLLRGDSGTKIWRCWGSKFWGSLGKRSPGQQKDQGVWKPACIAFLKSTEPHSHCMCVCVYLKTSWILRLVRGFNFCLNGFLHLGSSLIVHSGSSNRQSWAGIALPVWKKQNCFGTDWVLGWWLCFPGF